MLLVQDRVGYLCIYTHQVRYLLIYVKGLLEISEQNIRLASIALVCVVGILTWLRCAGGKPGQMKELNMETRSRNIAVTGQNSLETNCSKLTQAVILLSALQERSEQEYLFSLPPPTSFLS